MDKVISPYVIPGIRIVDMSFTANKCKEAIKCLTEHYKMREGSILARTRKNEIVYVRHLLIYFMRKELRGGLVEIGNCLGLDHSTAIHAIKQFSDRLDTNSLLPLLLRTKHDYAESDYAETRRILLQSL